MAVWLQTVIGVLTAISLVSAVAVKPAVGYLRGLRNEWKKGLNTLRSENTEQHARTEAQLGQISGTLSDIGQHFDEDGALGREVGTLPSRVRVLEGQMRTVTTNMETQ